MIRCVMSVKVLDVEESLPLSSVLMSPVCSTTVNTAGPRFTLDPAESSTNRSSKRELTDLGLYHSDGVKKVINVVFEIKGC